MKAFRRQYTEGKNLVVAQDVDRAYTRTYGDVSVRFVGLRDLLSHL